METYFLGAYWGNRKESVEQCTARVLECLSALEKCDQAFSRWFQRGRSRKQALEGEFHVTTEAIKERLLQGRSRRDVGGDVIEELGFSLSLWNGGKDCEDVGFSIQCGAYAGSPNSCVVNLPSEGPPSERLLNVESLLCLMRAVVTSFEPDWATVMPDSLLRTIQFLPGRPTSGWLFYVANSAFPSARFPSTARAVSIPNRGNVAVVTEEQFSPNKLEHQHAREAVEAAMVSVLHQ